MALSRFRQAKTAEEEVNLVQNGVPKSTQYKNKWAYGIFEERQRQRLVKVPTVEVAGLFKNYDYRHVESLETLLVEISVRGGGGGSTKNIFIRGGSAPRFDPLPFYTPFLIEKIPLSYTFHWKIVPLSQTYLRTLYPLSSP